MVKPLVELPHCLSMFICVYHYTGKYGNNTEMETAVLAGIIGQGAGLHKQGNLLRVVIY